MDERVRFIADWQRQGLSVSELCRRYGISRKTGYKWIARYEAEGCSGLAERCRAPHSNGRSMSDEVGDLLVAERKAHRYWGARKVLAVLRERHPDLAFPSASTAHAVLDRAGLVTKRRRRGEGICEDASLVSADRPNAVLCVDFKGEFRLGNRQLCYPLTVMDCFSRYLLCCSGQASTHMAGAFEVLDWVFGEYGLPDAIRSDNGTPFASSGAGRLTRLSVWWLKLGIVLDRIWPGRPQENGRQERMHRTLKAEATRPPGYDLSDQQMRFDAFQVEYNEERPHEALGQVPPARVYEASSRAYTGEAPAPEYPGHFEVRSVRRSGEIRWRGGVYYLSQALVGERVGLFEVDDGIWWIAFAAHHIGVYDARQDKVFPVRSGVGRGKTEFSASGSPDQGRRAGQSAGNALP